MKDPEDFANAETPVYTQQTPVWCSCRRSPDWPNAGWTRNPCHTSFCV